MGGVIGWITGGLASGWFAGVITRTGQRNQADRRLRDQAQDMVQLDGPPQHRGQDAWNQGGVLQGFG